MTEFISSLEIEQFRSLSSLKIQNLGNVNLITGKNNSGKSSLLEAIRIASTGGSYKTLYDIMNYREELSQNGDPERGYLPSDIAAFCSLFNGFPSLAKCKNGFTILAKGSDPHNTTKIKASIGWFHRKTDPERQITSYEPATGDLFEEVDSFPAFDLSVNDRKRIIPIDRVSRRNSFLRDTDTASRPCIYLDPFSSRSTSQMGLLWDAIALTDSEGEVVKALQVMSPDIQAISMIGSDDRINRPRTAIAKSNLYASPVPLRTFGDGVNRLFGIILSLCSARDGVLLIDELENGIHYSVMLDVWKIIFRISKSLNVQIFATSHSWDCVRAFQEAASESPEDGVLVRLTKKDSTTIATVFTESELGLVARDQIEVR